MEVVVVLGASSDPSRYSYKAIKMLQEFNHCPIPVHPKESEILGLKVFKDLEDVKTSYPKIDTLTVYLRPEISTDLKKSIIDLSPRRVIFNPGAENAELEEALKKSGVKVENACTLVLLRTRQF
jgi:predicted CoA-binding protein